MADDHLTIVGVNDQTQHPCWKGVQPHICQRWNCPKDDPDWVHFCFADDFDFTEGELVKHRTGRLTDEEFFVLGSERAAERRQEFLRRLEAGESFPAE